MAGWRRSLAAAALSCGACAGSSFVPEPQNADVAGIGIEVVIHLPVSLFESDAQIVYFARVDGGEGVERDTVIPSTVSRKDRIYLLNAPPGEYVAVAAEWTETTQSPPTQPGSGPGAAQTHTYEVLFPREVIERTRVAVAPGHFAFAGRLSVDASAGGLRGADAAQRHYGGILAPGSQRPLGQMTSAVSGRIQYLATLRSLDQGEGARADMRRLAEKDLASSGWIPILGREE